MVHEEQGSIVAIEELERVFDITGAQGGIELLQRNSELSFEVAGLVLQPGGIEAHNYQWRSSDIELCGEIAGKIGEVNLLGASFELWFDAALEPFPVVAEEWIEERTRLLHTISQCPLPELSHQHFDVRIINPLFVPVEHPVGKGCESFRPDEIVVTWNGQQNGIDPTVKRGGFVDPAQKAIEESVHEFILFRCTAKGQIPGQKNEIGCPDLRNGLSDAALEVAFRLPPETPSLATEMKVRDVQPLDRASHACAPSTPPWERNHWYLTIDGGWGLLN